jgi:hypothetical protein
MVFEIVATERITELNAEMARARFADEFAKGTKYQTEEGHEGEILDSKLDIAEEIL